MYTCDPTRPWSWGSTACPYIKRDLDHAAIDLMRATGEGRAWGYGRIDMVIGPDEALLVACSRETREYIMQMPYVYGPPRATRNDCWQYGLLDRLYGFRVFLNLLQPPGEVDLVLGGTICTITNIR